MRVRGLAAAAVLVAGLGGCVAGDVTATPPLAGGGEQPAMAGADGRVKRDGGRLVITLGNGGALEFSDYRGKPQAGMYWDAVSHLYRGRLGGGRYHLVERTAYGRTHGVLVDAVGGASWSVPGIVVISPDGERLLVLPDESGAKHLQIWSVAGPRPKVELDTVPGRPIRFESWQGDRILLKVPDRGGMNTVSLEPTRGAWEVPEPLRH